MSYKVKYVVPEQTNWGNWLTFTPDKPYMLGEDISYLRFSETDGIRDIINAINLGEVELENQDIDFQPWYSYDFDKNYKPLIKYTAKNIDADWFIESEVKDGVYKPEPNTVKNIISSYGEYFDKDLLVKHKVHTIQLRTTAHFDVARTFNIPKGCKINASKVIITLYGYEKFCGDDKMISEIKKEKSKEIAKAKSIIENNKFTLMKNGKVIINNKDKYEIITYLEKFTAKDVDSKILDDIKPIFDNFDIEKFYICYWGVYDKYEMRGHKCDLNFETNSLNNEVIDSDILEQIYSLYEDSIPYLDEREINLVYGTPDMGVQVLGVLKNKKGKLETFIEDYDLL
jgi:hypothetical protein